MDQRMINLYDNDTGARRYNKQAFDLAWRRTLAFFREDLGPTPQS